MLSRKPAPSAQFSSPQVLGVTAYNPGRHLWRPRFGGAANPAVPTDRRGMRKLRDQMGTFADLLRGIRVHSNGGPFSSEIESASHHLSLGTRWEDRIIFIAGQWREAIQLKRAFDRQRSEAGEFRAALEFVSIEEAVRNCERAERLFELRGCATGRNDVPVHRHQRAAAAWSVMALGFHDPKSITVRVLRKVRRAPRREL